MYCVGSSGTIEQCFTCFYTLKIGAIPPLQNVDCVNKRDSGTLSPPFHVTSSNLRKFELHSIYFPHKLDILPCTKNVLLG